MAVDLHLHSTFSDGTLSPEAIVHAALDQGLTAISITDHDTVEATAPALRAARGTGLDVIPGVEVSTDYRHTEVHILGYYIDVACPELLERLAVVREARQGRARQIVAKLEGLGLNVGLEEVLRQAGDGSVGRPHVAAALVAGGCCATQQEAFERYLKKGRPGYVPRYKLTPTEAVQLIARAGGCPVLAHPGLISGEEDLPYRLVGEGLEGLEAYHIDHTTADTQRAQRLAGELGLIVTGGSDSHGPAAVRPVAVGAVEVPDSCAEQLRQWVARKGAFSQRGAAAL